MKELVDDINAWLAAGVTQLAVATVLSTWGSAPRKVGAKMVFSADGKFITGSVSGGCVEGAVISVGEEVLMTGRPQLLRFGVTDETAWEVGLACGGTTEVLVDQFDFEIYHAMREWIAGARSGAVITVIRGPEEMVGHRIAIEDGRIVTGSLDRTLDTILPPLVDEFPVSTRHVLHEDLEVFIDVMQPSPKLVIVGGAHIAVVLAQLGKLMSYQVILVDPRRAFGSQSRFPGVDRLIQDWPDKALAEIRLNQDSAVVTLSHDPKIDDPALAMALDSPAFYIGALGSRKTHARRCERLIALGYSEMQIARIYAPVGMDIGADNPEEIALAVMGQIVAVYRSLLET
jgi:xanthine dehydrogenase accessory factor